MSGHKLTFKMIQHVNIDKICRKINGHQDPVMDVHFPFTLCKYYTLQICSLLELLNYHL